jgi:hypothetical protein
VATSLDRPVGGEKETALGALLPAGLADLGEVPATMSVSELPGWRGGSLPVVPETL